MQITFDNQGYALSSGPITAYAFDDRTGLFKGAFETQAIKGSTMPAHSTAVAPPSAQPNTAPVWDANKGEWILVESHIGQTVWDKATAQPHTITDPGPISQTDTTTQPSGDDVKWDEVSGGWVIDKAARAQSLKDQALNAMGWVQQQAPVVLAMGETFGPQMRQYVEKLRAILSSPDTTSTELPTPPNDPTV